MPEFELVELEETPYLFVERSCAQDPGEIAEAMGSAFTEVWAFMEKHGVAPAGGALSVYYSYEPHRLDFRAGFIVGRDDLAAADDTVKGDVTPAGRTVHGTHKGAYTGIKQSYGEMFGFVQSEGVSFTAPTWEIYMNDPGQVPEDQLITELYQALEA